MASQNVPSRLWDYGLVYKAEILSWMPPAGSDCTGYEILMGEMPNITEWLDFSFYDLVWYHVSSNGTTTQPRRLGRWLGVSHRMGSALCYGVLTQFGQVISSMTVQHVTDNDHQNPELTATITMFDTARKECHDDTNFIRDDIPALPPTSRIFIPHPWRTATASFPLTRNMGTCFLKSLLKTTHTKTLIITSMCNYDGRQWQTDTGAGHPVGQECWSAQYSSPTTAILCVSFEEGDE